MTGNGSSYPWKNRWRIVGTLTTETPLHIGSGMTTTHPDLTCSTPDGGTRPVQISAIMCDAEGRPVLPGATIKGNLRAWLEANGNGCVEGLLGSRSGDGADPVGGKCTFHNARIPVGANPPDFDERPSPPYWQPTRFAAIRAGVSIDRITGTAVDQKLFYHEYVPAGTPFSLTITGQDLNDDEVEALLGALRAFNPEASTDRVTLGASSGDGWGRFRWSLERAESIGLEQVESWLNDEDAGVSSNIEGLDRSSLTPWVPGVARPVVTIDLDLEFDGPFLVNDPSRCGKGQELPNHAPLLDDRGDPFLPASSIRGALRSQAERILRTLGGDQAACPGGDTLCDATRAVAEARAKGHPERWYEQLCFGCRVFGAPGWKAPVSFEDFTSETDVEVIRQEFVAIDRFTGGAAAGLKFNQDAADRPRLRGRLQVDLQALSRVGGMWSLGLLALVLRDLAEGDIPMGLGGTRGNGTCRVADWTVKPPPRAVIPPVFSEWLPENLPASIDVNFDSESIRTAVGFFVADLGETLEVDALAQGGA